MQADALAQALVARKWTKPLVLHGPGPDDQLLLAAFARSDRHADVIEGIWQARRAGFERIKLNSVVMRLFDKDPASPALYHMILDSTVLPIEVCVELIAAAAVAYWARSAPR